ncbi:uncharacterized protein A4U43_C07F15340 [Asparagus officinalis]|uniref:Uncharacterized protein n=1 Tax=Asparagus officinalis TaxID=4686 RepID=A0A5P1EC50_ASPOF|nr:uncharacterized protein LOC109849989 [Asparagus officinalis]ONK63456.1 uncharacterized protein A4U43_C07F15340 [Asparagus officinalis]
MEKATVNFLVGKVKQRVVLVEADSNFVDILFSLCDFPLGTIVRLLNKQSYSGCLNKLYESIENLNVQNFQAKACKIMLLFPQSAAAERGEDLKVNIDSTEPKPMAVYVCAKRGFHAKPTCFGRSVPNVRCPHCRELTVNLIRRWPEWDVDAGKLFVKSGDKFMISDDLHLTLASTEHSLSLIQKLIIEDACVL